MCQRSGLIGLVLPSVKKVQINSHWLLSLYLFSTLVNITLPHSDQYLKYCYIDRISLQWKQCHCSLSNSILTSRKHSIGITAPSPSPLLLLPHQWMHSFRLSYLNRKYKHNWIIFKPFPPLLKPLKNLVQNHISIQYSHQYNNVPQH